MSNGQLSEIKDLPRAYLDEFDHVINILNTQDLKESLGDKQRIAQSLLRRVWDIYYTIVYFHL
jgi:hypothetical protein